ncbi:hypothetical protein VPHF86_0255 [Vibrio phage F86]
MITETLRTNIRSITNENCTYNIRYAFAMFEEHDFGLIDADIDGDTINSIEMLHEQTQVVVILKPNAYFGSNVTVTEDPHNITKGEK